MTRTDINTLADEAANEAVRYIQERMDIPTGDFAGLYFSDHTWDDITQILSGYIAAEIMEGKSK
jgi:hypothetical protein